MLALQGIFFRRIIFIGSIKYAPHYMLAHSDFNEISIDTYKEKDYQYLFWQMVNI